MARAYLSFTEQQSEQIRKEVSARSPIRQDQVARAARPWPTSGENTALRSATPQDLLIRDHTFLHPSSRFHENNRRGEVHTRVAACTRHVAHHAGHQLRPPPGKMTVGAASRCQASKMCPPVSIFHHR
jgi:hypothetical protein